jgi:DNA-binding transcriptional ArsR family regulator
VHAFDVLGDPVRRRILELLATGEHSSGELARAVAAEFGISHPAVSQHLRVLRDHGFTSVRAEGTRRLYAVEPGPLRELDAWVEQFRGFWSQRLDALGTELRRGASGRTSSARQAPAPPTGAPQTRAPQTRARQTRAPRAHPPRTHPEETR